MNIQITRYIHDKCREIYENPKIDLLGRSLEERRQRNGSKMQRQGDLLIKKFDIVGHRAITESTGAHWQPGIFAVIPQTPTMNLLPSKREKPTCAITRGKRLGKCKTMILPPSGKRLQVAGTESMLVLENYTC